MASDKRFVKVWSDGAFGSNEIWVDQETGVNYLFHASGYAGGLTPLLNRDGTPVVTPVPSNYKD
ncbi:MAG: xylan 1,4-beta-xylosidase [Oscillospiraceae bacterium]|nr:xylan 1,4-beta-xylosidase [Oscillospiraceae bacterium]